MPHTPVMCVAVDRAGRACGTPAIPRFAGTREGKPMFLEQRMYTAHPGKLPGWLKAYAEIGGPASSRTLTPQIGMFTVEFGQINRVLFLRGFDDIDQRERGLAARDADPEGQRFLVESRNTGALMAQEAKLLKTVDFSPIQKVGQPFERKIEG